jgi:hypothetical protein
VSKYFELCFAFHSCMQNVRPHARVCNRSPSNFMHMLCLSASIAMSIHAVAQCNCTVQSCACICASWLRRLMPRIQPMINLEGWRRSRTNSVTLHSRALPPALLVSLIDFRHVLYPHTFRGQAGFTYPWLSEYLFVLVNTLHTADAHHSKTLPLAWATTPS